MKDPKSAEIIRPILRGRDIKRYGYDWTNSWLINVHNGLPEKGINPIDIDDYPAIKSFLDIYYPRLMARTDKGKTPYNLRSCAYLEDFNKQKIVYSEIVQSPRFHLDNEKFHIEATAFMLTGNNLNYLTCMLNSKTVSQIFRTFYAGGGLGAKGYRYKKNYLINLPLPNPTEDIEKQFASLLLNVRHKPNKKETINEIEDLVISLLDLNQEQKDWIFKKS